MSRNNFNSPALFYTTGIEYKVPEMSLTDYNQDQQIEQDISNIKITQKDSYLLGETRVLGWSRSKCSKLSDDMDEETVAERIELLNSIRSNAITRSYDLKLSDKCNCDELLGRYIITLSDPGFYALVEDLIEWTSMYKKMLDKHEATLLRNKSNIQTVQTP